jgi:RND family efflux transporter MFP subunit
VQETTKPPIHVDTANAVDVDAPILLHLTGSLKGMKMADLAANSSGRVIRTYVEPGDEVKEGSLVAQLDTSAAGLAMKQAHVDVLTQKTQEEINLTECARNEKLFAAGAISSAEHDSVTAKCKTAPLVRASAEARENIFAKNVGDGTIRAPFDGVVSERFVEVGEYVQAESKVIALTQSRELRLELAVPEADIASVKSGAAITFKVAAYPDKTFQGTVRFVSGALRESTRDLVCVAIVPNEEKLLRPNMFADVDLATGTEKLPSVPTAAVFERQDTHRVYVVVNGQLEERVLQTGPEMNGRLVVRAGIKEGEKVAIGNLTALTNGAQVE